MIKRLSKIMNHSHFFLIVVEVYDVITYINSLLHESKTEYWEYIPRAL